MGRFIDFDSFRAEQHGEPVQLQIGGEVYNLPSGLPADVALDAVRVQNVVAPIVNRADLTPAEKRELINAELGKGADEFIVKTGRSLFGEELFAMLLEKHRLTVDELPVLIQQTFAAYNAAAAGPAPNRATRRASKPARSR